MLQVLRTDLFLYFLEMFLGTFSLWVYEYILCGMWRCNSLTEFALVSTITLYKLCCLCSQ
jgi:hypothetical protein